MTDILFILVVIAAVLFYILRKPRPSIKPLEQSPVVEAKPEVIEDTSHLKEQLVETQQLYTSALKELGQFQLSVQQLSSQVLSLSAAKNSAEEALAKVTSQKKSSEVRTGTFVEILAPIAEQFCVDPKTMRFLGSPIDYVSFDYDKNMITFVEVKSGESQLNSNQKAVKRMVEEGRVEFKVVRLNEKGIKVK